MLLAEKVHGCAIRQSSAGFHFDADLTGAGVDDMRLDGYTAAFLTRVAAGNGERDRGSIARNLNIIDQSKEAPLPNIRVLPKLEFADLAGEAGGVYRMIAKGSVASFSATFTCGASI